MSNPLELLYGLLVLFGLPGLIVGMLLLSRTRWYARYTGKVPARLPREWLKATPDKQGTIAGVRRPRADPTDKLGRPDPPPSLRVFPSLQNLDDMSFVAGGGDDEPAVVAFRSTRVQVHIHPHTVRAGSASTASLSLVTEGLAALYGQQELCLSYLSDAAPTELHPRTVQLLSFLRLVVQLAQDGKLVGTGGQTTMNPPGPGLLDRYYGVIYVPALPLPGFTPPERALALVPLTRGEVRLAHFAGHARILSRLGRQANHVPYPTWLDPDRDEVYHPNDERSLLQRLPHIYLPGAQGLWEWPLAPTEPPDPSAARPELGGLLHVLVAADMRVLLADWIGALRADMPFAICLGAPEAGQACVVWDAETQRFGVLAEHPGRARRVALSFIAFGRTSGDTSLTRLVEDGLGMLLVQDDMARLRASLTEGTPLSLPTEGAVGLVQIYAEAAPRGEGELN